MNKGKLISCWSGFGHQNGVTTFASLLSYMLSELYPSKSVLTLDMNYRFAILEDVLGAKGSKSIDNLLNMYCTDNITKEKFCECLVNVKKNNKETNIYNLNASKNNVFNSINEYTSALESILDVALDVMDFVIIDNSAGINDVTHLVNSRADIVVNMLKQNRYTLDYVARQNQIGQFNNDKHINLVNVFSEDKGISLKMIEKDWGLKQLQYLPLHEGLEFYFNDNSLHSILLEENCDFNHRLKKVSVDILAKLDLNIEEFLLEKEKEPTGLKKVLMNLKPSYGKAR